MESFTTASSLDKLTTSFSSDSSDSFVTSSFRSLNLNRTMFSPSPDSLQRSSYHKIKEEQVDVKEACTTKTKEINTQHKRSGKFKCYFGKLMLYQNMHPKCTFLDFKSIWIIITYRERTNSYVRSSAFKRLSETINNAATNREKPVILPEVWVDPKSATGRLFEKERDHRRHSDLVLPKLADIDDCEEEEEEKDDKDGGNDLHQKGNKYMPQDSNYKSENKDGEQKKSNERCKRRRNVLTKSKRVRVRSLDRETM